MDESTSEPRAPAIELTQESGPSVPANHTRQPKKRFVGRKTADAQAQKHAESSDVGHIQRG